MILVEVLRVLQIKGKQSGLPPADLTLGDWNQVLAYCCSRGLLFTIVVHQAHCCSGDYPFAREQDCDLRLFDFEAFGGFGKEVRSTLREAANQLSNKLSHAQHLDEVTWTTKNWHGLQMQRLSVVLHTAVAWQTVNELACGESGIVHGAECIAVLNGVA